MAQNKGSYKEVTETEKKIIYNFLERLKNDIAFREGMKKNPEIILSASTPTNTYADLLRPNLLELLGNMRRVAFEEIGIDVSEYRDVVADNGFKITRDDKM